MFAQGDVSKVALGHRTGGDNRRKKRETVNGFVIIMDNIQPDKYFPHIIAHGLFDLSVDNEFMLFAYESNLTKPTSVSDSGRIVFEAEGNIYEIHQKLYFQQDFINVML